MDKIIHIIINHDMLMINLIINHNLLNTTNVNSIVSVEEHNKIVTKMIMMEKKWENMSIFIVEYLHLTKKIPIIPLVNNSYARNNNPTDSS